MYHTFNFIEHLEELYQFDDLYIFCDTVGCRLRRHDPATMDYSPSGIFEAGDIVMPNVTGTVIRQFTGVYVEATVPTDTSIGYRASFDGGTTWQWYNGTAWALAGPNEWSTLEQIDEGVAAVSGKPVRLKLHLTPSPDGFKTPEVNLVHIFYEGTWAYFEDLKRSIKQHIDANMVCNLTWAAETASSGMVIPFTTPWQTILGIDAAFDLTVDPTRQANIFSSLNPGDPPTISFTGSVPSGHVIEVRYRARCPIYLAADENLEVSQVPAVVVVIPRAREDKISSKNLFEYEPLVSHGVVRRRDRPVPINSQIVIYQVAATDQDALVLQDSVAELFQPERSFRSAAIGEDFTCLSYEPLIDHDQVASGLHVKTTQIVVIGYKELRSYADVKPAEEIRQEFVASKPVDGVSRSIDAIYRTDSGQAPWTKVSPSEEKTITEEDFEL